MASAKTADSINSPLGEDCSTHPLEVPVDKSWQMGIGVNLAILGPQTPTGLSRLVNQAFELAGEPLLQTGQARRGAVVLFRRDLA